MQEYLAILLRTEFNLIYRLGYGVLFKNQIIPFDGIVNESLNHKLVGCFDKLTPFEYDEEYLILHLSLPTVMEESFEVRTEYVNSIYPLSKQAKVSIESKIDSRIRLEDPKFENAIELVKDRIQRKSIEMATEIVYKICALGDVEKDLIPLDEIIKGLEKRKLGAKGGNYLTGSFWEILIGYDRYDYFPNSTLGYLYDVGNVFSYYKGKKDGVVGTKIFELLERLNSTDSKIKLPKIISSLEQDQLAIKFIEENNAIGKGIVKPYLAAILFLKWKDELRNPEKTLTTSNVFFNGKVSFYNEHPKEVTIALHLLASFFGFNRFYDEFYNAANFKFFKNYTSTTDISIIESKISTTVERRIDEISESSKKEESQEATPVSNEDLPNYQSNETDEVKVIESTNIEIAKNEKVTKIKKGKAGTKKSPKSKDQPKLDL